MFKVKEEKQLFLKSSMLTEIIWFQFIASKSPYH